jgi:two-component system nitrate/nitrite response regulator NarL
VSLPARQVRVFVADDHPLYLDSVLRVVHQRPDMIAVGEAADGRAALGAIVRLRPDVAILDVRMPGLDGLEVLGALRAAGVDTRALLLSAHGDGELAYDAMAAGARGYLLKDARADAIADAIVTVASGGTVLAAAAQDGLLAQLAAGGRGRPSVLSERERQVLELSASGYTAAAVGSRLHLSGATVKSHLQTAYEKLGVSDRTAAVAEALRRGLIA